jgi:hypothetical protein
VRVLDRVARDAGEREIVPEVRRAVGQAPARISADAVGFGTVMSPLANWMITAFGEDPVSGSARMCGAYRHRIP